MQLFHFSNFITYLLTFILTSLFQCVETFPLLFLIHTHSHPQVTLDLHLFQ